VRGRSTQALDRRSKWQAQATPIMPVETAIGLTLRLRGPIAALQCYQVNGVQAVQSIVASHHFVCEACCVSRHRSCDHKVARSRAQLAAVLRGSARSSVISGLSVGFAGFRRCYGSQARKSASLKPCPSSSAALRRPTLCHADPAASASVYARPSNIAFERTVQALALARGRRGGQSASAARWKASGPAAQRGR
jgi:hypothetical protein